MAISVVTYKVRGGQITPVVPSCTGTGVPTQFIMQTFGVEKTVVDIDSAKTTLLASSDMQGQKPGDVEDEAYRASTYSSASYSGRPLRTTDGELVFSSSESHVSEFVEEEEIGLI
jgi:hypothetical protein